MATPEELVAKARKSAEEALSLHPYYRGKVQVAPKCPVRGLSDFSIWYSPGVAAPCEAIHLNPDLVYDYTNRGNSIAVVSDGTRVLGLGDIGPEAALPVMEGKALLFKYLGGVDAVPLCLGTKDPDEFIRAVKLLEPSFGGINLEDISQPKCFRILDSLRMEMGIPVWHDDQQGTATVILAALLNALKVVGKEIGRARIAFIGVGSANVAVYRLLRTAGIDPAKAMACDTGGTLHRNRSDLEASQEEYADKWRICQETNPDCVSGGIAEALREVDVCIALSSSGPGVIRPEWVSGMAKDATAVEADMERSPSQCRNETVDDLACLGLELFVGREFEAVRDRHDPADEGCRVRVVLPPLPQLLQKHLGVGQLHHEDVVKPGPINRPIGLRKRTARRKPRLRIETTVFQSSIWAPPSL